MREIKFRGIGIGTSKWYYGNLRVISARKIAVENGIYIVPTDTLWHKIEVEPESVGQYTGLRDKNRRAIYEGDIVKQRREWDGIIVRGEVIFRKGMFVVRDCEHREYLLNETAEVIGNIYEFGGVFYRSFLQE